MWVVLPRTLKKSEIPKPGIQARISDSPSAVVAVPEAGHDTTMGSESLRAAGTFSSLKNVFNLRDRLCIPKGEKRSPSFRMRTCNVHEIRSASKIALSSEVDGNSKSGGLGNRRAAKEYVRPPQCHTA